MAERGANALMPGEFPLTASDLKRIAEMLREDAGIFLSDGKAPLVYSRLSKRLRALGLKNFREYCNLVASDEGSDERKKMLAALTTNVTQFYREPHHFEHLEKRVLPPLLEAARRGGRVRLWSAACSNGQEPYTMALSVLKLLPDAASYDIRILATDIDANMVAEGKRGVYSTATLKPVPQELRKSWFTPLSDESDSEMAVGQEMRRLVIFKELNLLGTWPMRGRFDAIFCRNVVIYFEEETQQRVWSRFAPMLVPGSFLYIGHSERISGPAAASFQNDGVTTYRLREGGRS